MIASGPVALLPHVDGDIADGEVLGHPHGPCDAGGRGAVPTRAVDVSADRGVAPRSRCP
jgi:hypothetical protein